ncbi:MAG: TIGR02452 family protein [Oscillospiraceae bacterium]|nr:TIGR02452 family protein [Oscillospiraceae bacterium]
MGREENIAVFDDTMAWFKTSKKLSGAISGSIDGTKLYTVDEMPKPTEKRYTETKIAVTKSRSFEAAFRLRQTYPDMKIGVHNFASAVHPGGGVAKGSTAQEEALCRCSTLYPVLNTGYLRRNYYDINKKQMDPANTDAIIYTPDILIIKTDTKEPQRIGSEKWVTVDVLTAAAPDLRRCIIDDENLFRLHAQRARKILAVASDRAIDVLVLGAFGCGAFKNDPLIVAKAYKEVLPEFNGCFKEIEFAVFCSSYDTGNYTAFCNTLS